MHNVYYDTAAVPLLYQTQVYKSVVDIVGAEKILYGSDYPLLLFPKKTRTPGFTKLLSQIKNSGLTASQLDLILGGNIQRILATAS